MGDGATVCGKLFYFSVDEENFSVLVKGSVIFLPGYNAAARGYYLSALLARLANALVLNGAEMLLAKAQ